MKIEIELSKEKRERINELLEINGYDKFECKEDWKDFLEECIEIYINRF